MKVLITPNYKKENTKEALKKALSVLKRCDTEYEIIDLSDKAKISENICGDLLLYIGGDGTFIRSAYLAYRLNIPIVGINTGNVGHLSKIGFDEIEERLSEIVKCRYEIAESFLLSLECGNITTSPIINDIIFSAKNTVEEFCLYEEGELILKCVASALVIATSIGSTGLNKSAGGSVMLPGTKGIAVTPICVQMGDHHSVIASGKSTLRLECASGIKICFDGGESFEFCGNLKMSLIDKPLKVIK